MYDPFLIIKENDSCSYLNLAFFLFSLKTVTNLFLANSDFKFTGNGFSLPQLDSGISGKTNELRMKQGQLDSKKIWRRD